MSQDKLIKLVAVGDKNGAGKGHVYFTRKNKKKHAQTKFEFKKFNPITRTHQVYKEKK
jgi:ribosomal protein L33